MGRHDDAQGRCLALLETLSDYLEGDLSEAERRRIEAHMRACCRCQVCYETLKRTVDLCRGAHDEPVPPEFSTRIQRLLAERLKAGGRIPEP